MFSFHNLHFFVMEIIAIYTDKNSASLSWNFLFKMIYQGFYCLEQKFLVEMTHASAAQEKSIKNVVYKNTND